MRVITPPRRLVCGSGGGYRPLARPAGGTTAARGKERPVAHVVIDARHRQSSTGRYIDRLLRGLEDVDRHHRYTVLLAEGDDWAPVSPRFRTEHVDVAQYSLDEQWGLWHRLRALAPDLVHFPMPQQPLLYRGRTVTTVHDLTLVRFLNGGGNPLVERARRAVFSLLLRRVARRSAAVITPTAHTRADLVGWASVPPERVHVTHEAGDSLAVDPVPVPALAGRRFVLSVGNAYPYKNLARLLEAWTAVAPQHPDAVLVLVGRRSPFYDALAEGAPGSVVFLHDADDAQLRWLYQQALFFVFPSLSEGFGLPGLEAMELGCPVLASRLTCLPEVYGDAARYFDALDPADMAREIGRLLEDDDARAALAEAGRAHAAGFSWTRTAEQTLAVYEEALAGTGRPPVS